MSSSLNSAKAPVKTTGRPLRALAIMAIIVVGLLGTALIQGASSVRLGLDLRGGTSEIGRAHV